MPYVDNTGDIAAVTLAFDMGNGQFEESVVHYRDELAGSGDSRAAVLSFVNSGVSTYILPQLPATANYYGSRLSFVKSLAPWSPVVVYDGTVGGSAVNALPTQTRGLMSWKTALSGRAYRGRTYLPSTTTAYNTAAGKPLLALLTAWQAWGNYMLVPVVSGGTTWKIGLFHRVPTAVISSSFDLFTGATVGQSFATQRRSGDYGRVNAPPF